MTKSFVSETSASGEEIHAIVCALEPVLASVTRPLGIIACLSIALQLMDPEITADKLQEGVKETSRFICMFLEEVPGPEIPKEKLN